jgi:chromosome segregation ATPase
MTDLEQARADVDRARAALEEQRNQRAELQREVNHLRFRLAWAYDEAAILRKALKRVRKLTRALEFPDFPEEHP